MEKLAFGARVMDLLPYEPNEQQVKLIAALARYVCEDPQRAPLSADRVFVLNGYAGTGKTTLTGALVKALGEAGVPVVLLAPTGRAAKVLGAACGHPAYTIHRRIYRGDGLGGISTAVSENTLEGAAFIVDEASMIGEMSQDSPVNLLQDLVQYVFSGAGCRLILVGDTAQLPPVGCETSPAMNPDRLHAMGLLTTRATITAPARQRIDSGILYNATLQRKMMQADPKKEPVIVASKFADVRVTDDPEELQEQIERDLREDDDGPAETIIITLSNRRATEFNRSLRHEILGYEEELVTGERLMVVKNNYLWSRSVKGLDFIANGDVCTVERIVGTEERYGLRWADVDLSMPDYGVTFQAKIMLDTLCSLSAGLDADYAETFRQRIMADPDLFAPGMTDQQRYRKLRDNPYWNALQVKYAYCVTCHKAQGGQWRNLYVDFSYMPPSDTYLETYRWLYTATTRATRRLTFIHPIVEVR